MAILNRKDKADEEQQISSRLNPANVEIMSKRQRDKICSLTIGQIEITQEEKQWVFTDRQSNIKIMTYSYNRIPCSN